MLSVWYWRARGKYSRTPPAQTIERWWAKHLQTQVGRRNAFVVTPTSLSPHHPPGERRRRLSSLQGDRWPVRQRTWSTAFRGALRNSIKPASKVDRPSTWTLLPSCRHTDRSSKGRWGWKSNSVVSMGNLDRCQDWNLSVVPSLLTVPLIFLRDRVDQKFQFPLQTTKTASRTIEGCSMPCSMMIRRLGDSLPQNLVTTPAIGCGISCGNYDRSTLFLRHCDFFFPVGLAFWEIGGSHQGKRF